MRLRPFRHLTRNPLEALFGLSTSQGRFEAILKRARSAHGELIDLIPPVLEEEARQQDIILRRHAITSDEHRFFLALLLNVPRREGILRLVSQRFPDKDPADCVLDWIEELGQTKAVGSVEPNVLGIDGFDDRHVLVIECLLKGSLRQEGKGRPREHPGGHAHELGPDFADIRNRLQQSKLFRSLIGNSR